MKRNRKYNGIIMLAALLLLPLLISTTGCGGTSSDVNTGANANAAANTNTGTLGGTVLFWEGDFMPGSPPRGTKTPVVREIHVFEAATHAQATPVPPYSGPFYSAIQSRLVTTTMSDSNGRFSLVLPAATYSLFVRENGQYYANGMTGEFIYPVDVVSGATTTITFDITYMASF